MPFWYHVPIPTLPHSEPGPVTRLVIIEVPRGGFAILANGGGFLREKLFPNGAELPPGTLPNVRPYSIAERIEASAEPSILSAVN